MFSLYLANFLRICSFLCLHCWLWGLFVTTQSRSAAFYKSNQIWYFISKTRQKQHCYFNKMSATKVGIKSPLQNYGHTSPSQPSLLCKIVSRLMHQAQIQSRNQVWSERGGGLFLGYKNLICFCYSRDGIPSPSPVHTPLPKSTFQFARLAPLLYLWHVPETSNGTALEKHQCYPHFSPPLLRPTPRLPNLIKLINSFPLHQYYSISFSFFCHPRPHL